MNLTSAIQLLINLPKILKAFKEFVNFMEARAKEKSEAEHQAALDKLKQAQTEQEKKDAFKDYLNKP